MEVFCSFPLTVLDLKLWSFTYFTLIYAQVEDRDLISSFYILLSSFIEETLCLLPLMIFFLEYIKIQVAAAARICFSILYFILLVYMTVGIVLYVSATVALQCIDHCGDSLLSFHLGLLCLFSTLCASRVHILQLSIWF